MKHKARAFALVVLSLVICSPALAGYHYRARTWSEGEGASDIVNMTIETFLDGEKVAVHFLESGNPFLKQGNRLISTDAGKTMYMVDDEAKTYSEWDLEGWLNSLGSITKGLGPALKIKIKNAKVETLIDEPGGTIAGLATTHYRTRTSYDLQIKVIGIGQTQHGAS